MWDGREVHGRSALHFWVHIREVPPLRGHKSYTFLFTSSCLSQLSYPPHPFGRVRWRTERWGDVPPVSDARNYEEPDLSLRLEFQSVEHTSSGVLIPAHDPVTSVVPFTRLPFRQGVFVEQKDVKNSYKEFIGIFKFFI